MPSIQYEAIYKRALTRMDDLNLASYDEEDFYTYMREWLHTTVSSPLLRKKFSSFSLNDELMKLDFTLSYSVDDDYDKEFVTSLLAKGVIVNYMPSRIDSDKNLAVMVGSDKEKKIIGNYSKNIERLNELKREWERDLTRHTYYFCEYGVSNG